MIDVETVLKVNHKILIF